MRRACIDIGSNTTRLLVADRISGGLVECAQERAFTHIGRSLGPDRVIPAATVEQVVAAVSGQLATARRLGASQIRCVATAGIRRAANRTAVVEHVRTMCDGLEVEVLSEADEARLAFIGAAWGSGAGSEQLGVVDVGGGSCELVAGHAPDHVQWWVSKPLGSGDVTSRWLKSDPPGPVELDHARERVREALAEGERPPQVPRVIAVGGSATSLRMLAGSLLDAEAFSVLLGLVRRHEAAALARRFSVDVERARLLAGGLLLLETVAELFGQPLELGRGGLREGLLLEP